MNLEHTLLLSDPITQRMILTWHLIPQSTLSSNSRLDICQAWSLVSQCDIDHIYRREPSLRGLSLVNLDGTVDPNATLYLQRLAIVQAAQIKAFDTLDPIQVIQVWVKSVDVVLLREWLMQSIPELFEDK